MYFSPTKLLTLLLYMAILQSVKTPKSASSLLNENRSESIFGKASTYIRKRSLLGVSISFSIVLECTCARFISSYKPLMLFEIFVLNCFSSKKYTFCSQNNCTAIIITTTNVLIRSRNRKAFDRITMS